MSEPSPLSISGFSTALYATWYFVDELGLLLDCGDGACAGLLQKSRKVRTIAISHADRDHLTGLPQFLQINVREKGLPLVIHPRDCGSFPALRDFLHDFDRFHLEAGEGNIWKPFEPGALHSLGKSKARLEAIRNRHIEAGGDQVRSLSYRVIQEHHRLKPECQGWSSEAIAETRNRLGDAAVMDFDSRSLLIYSADTPIEDSRFWGDTGVLIHEATFLHSEDAVSRGQDLRHSALDQVIPMATNLKLEALILGHFSTRYSHGEIRAAIAEECRRHRPNFPVFAVLPGEVNHDILRGTPIWEA